jgi:hypothetical protein
MLYTRRASICEGISWLTGDNPAGLADLKMPFCNVAHGTSTTCNRMRSDHHFGCMGKPHCTALRSRAFFGSCKSEGLFVLIGACSGKQLVKRLPYWMWPAGKVPSYDARHGVSRFSIFHKAYRSKWNCNHTKKCIPSQPFRPKSPARFPDFFL